MTTSLTSKGQLTLPIVIRKQLNLDKGARFRVELRGGEIVLIPQRGFENLRGILESKADEQE